MKKEELENEGSLHSQGQIELIEEILLYANLNNLSGQIKYKIISEYELDSFLNKLENEGGSVLDVQMSAASQGISVSAGDREGGRMQSTPVEAKLLIKYIGGK
jgi:hypothetical protein